MCDKRLSQIDIRSSAMWSFLITIHINMNNNTQRLIDCFNDISSNKKLKVASRAKSLHFTTFLSCVINKTALIFLNSVFLEIDKIFLILQSKKTTMGESSTIFDKFIESLKEKRLAMRLKVIFLLRIVWMNSLTR